MKLNYMELNNYFATKNIQFSLQYSNVLYILFPYFLFFVIKVIFSRLQENEAVFKMSDNTALRQLLVVINI